MAEPTRQGSGAPLGEAAGAVDGAASKAAAAPPGVAAISLPTAGGAIRNLGERFAANPVTGTGSLSVPVATSPGRNGFGPDLSLAYDSGMGNSPYGLGWALSPPMISRKTQMGVPLYRDSQDSDTFVLLGQQDLVPVAGDPPPPVTWGGRTYERRRLRPRQEGAFSRIERWTNVDDPADILWRTVAKDNVTNWYGLDASARVADPADPRRVHQWLLSEVHDDKGNVCAYSYISEDSRGVDLNAAHERNRAPATRAANRYLKRIRYGNRTPYRPVLDPAQRVPLPSQWLFEVVFDYGDHADDAPLPQPSRPWPVRPDPFSTYRAGFEVRTYRRCRRVLMFHHFPNQAGVGPDCLVGSTDLTYADELPSGSRHPAGYSFLASVALRGYVRDGDGYRAKALPPVEFTYSAPRIDDTVRELPAPDRSGVPEGVDGGRYRWADLDGDGVAGVLSEQDGTWRYSRNLSPGEGRARLGPPVAVAAKPTLGRLEQGQFLADLAGDGSLDLVDLAGSMPGFHERTEDRTWGGFTPFESFANIDWTDPALRLVDLTGDGRPDVLITADDALVWYPSRGEAGFGALQRVAQALDEETGPRAVFTSDRESIALADLSGDGLVDLVRVRNSEVCYWPNLGHGRFGPKVTFDRSPVLARSDEFDVRRVLLADIDGSGTTDLIYAGSDGVRLYFNRSGNEWSDGRLLAGVGPVNEPQDLGATDLLGTGTICLILSSPLPADAHRPLRYVDLMSGGKPNLLTTAVNNLGGETRIRYAPSTRFAQADERAGRPWVTRLPFPVQVVEQIDTIDHVAGTRFVTHHAYHHGRYDGAEREFAGFAMVETQDTEEFDPAAVGGAGQDLSAEHHLPPITTFTWFHTGTPAPSGGFGHPLAQEYHEERRLLGDPELPEDLAPDERRECLRALRGVPLHREIYSFDGSPEQLLPYMIEEHRHRVRRIQPRGPNRHGVWAVESIETMTERWEREEDPADRRVAHSFNLAFDDYGHATRAAAVTYGREGADAALPAAVRDAQRQPVITYAELDQTPDIDVEGLRPAYRLRVPYATRSYDVTGIAPDGSRWTLERLRDEIAGIADIPYEQVADGTPQRRLVSHKRTLFRADDLSVRPLGQWDTLGLSYEVYELAFTPGTFAAYPAGSVTAPDLTAAGYRELDGDGHWWAPSGTVVFGPSPADHFYLPAGSRDPFGVETRQTLDAFDLLVERLVTVQATWQEVLARNDYRVLGPVQKTDPNGNRTVVALDELGMVVRLAVVGKAGDDDGDTLADPTMLAEYDLDAWRLHRRPVYVRTRWREAHGDPGTRWQERYAYADGRGEPTLIKERVARGPALRLEADGTVTEVAAADPRWRGNGRTIVNNKGLAVRLFDPYFSVTHAYEDAPALRERGEGPMQRYDSAGRVVEVRFPEGTTTRTEYRAWRQLAFDANDTILGSRWYSDRGSPDPTAEPEPADPQRRAAWLAAKHADTPGVVHYDALGRAIYAVSDLGGGVTRAARLEADSGGRFTKVFDQLGRLVTSGFSGLGGRPIYADSAEKGRSYGFVDVGGATVRSWDEHGRVLRAEYDELRRPVSVFAREGGDSELCVGHVVYGDQHPQARERNLRGTAHLVFDQAGMIRVPEIDFRGNPRRAERVLARSLDAVDWSPVAAAGTVAAAETAAAALLESETFAVVPVVDALGRPKQVTLPDSTVIAATYDVGGSLSRVQVRPQGSGPLRDVLTGQEHDEFGRRLEARFGNGLVTRNTYDELTARLETVTTVRAGADAATQALQALRYAYDPVGNLVAVDDAAQQTFFFNNAVVTPEARFEYDALYQLVSATGREHAGPNDAILTAADITMVTGLPSANDVGAVRRYIETYTYDAVGNITKLRHRYKTQTGAGAGWTRDYRYAYQVDPADRTNRLAATRAPGDRDAGALSAPYTHDVYGNMTRLPNVPRLEWNAFDQLVEVDLEGGGRARYVYGVGGQRVRRVIDRPGGLRIEHLYFGPYEVRRERMNDGPVRLEHHVVHLADAGGRIAQLETKVVDAQDAEPANPLGTPRLMYLYTSGVGGTRLMTDDAGTPILYEEFHPYGTTAYRAAKPGVSHSLKPYRFGGKHRDEETGLYAFGARYYAPWLGRWTSSDPAGAVTGGNLFRYCSNNPVGRGDGDGRNDRPLNPAGQVSWEIPSNVFQRNGQRLPDAQVIANFDRWMRQNHPDRPFTPGSVTIDWSSFRTPQAGRPGRGPTFNAEWINPSTGRPLLPRQGDFGYVAPTSGQPRAEYADPANRRGRLTENEHTTPGAQQRAVEPGYNDSAYRNDPQVRNPRNVALDKTRGDNARTQQIQADVAAGRPVNITDMDMDSHDRFQGANERARAAGQPHIGNPGSISRGTLEQMNARWERGRNQTLPPGTVIEEPNIAPTPGSNPPPAAAPAQTPPAPNPGGGGGGPRTGWIPAAMNTGGNVALGMTRTLVPGVVEAEIAFTGGSMWAYANGFATAGAALETAAAYTPVVGGSLVAGAIGGNFAESAVATVTENRDVQVAAGVIGAAATGAAVGALIGSVVPIAGTVIGAGAGAAVGAVAGLVGYALSKLW